MSVVIIGEEGRWSARVQACPSTPQTRLDGVLGAVGYAVAGVVCAYFGLVLGAGLGAAAGRLAGRPELLSQVGGGIGVAVPMLAMFAMWVRELARRAVVYELTARDTLRVVTYAGMYSPIPAAWIGAVSHPVPWPAALEGSAHDFSAPWSAIRGVGLEPHVLELQLSADRTVGLALRGADLPAMQALVERLGAQVG